MYNRPSYHIMNSYQDFNLTNECYFPPNPLPVHHSMQGPAIFNRYRPPPRPNHSEEYWCETCDRGFYSLELLEKHKQQHQKCNIDGCQFIAHPKVITKHIQMQHASGLYKKISKLNNPEEIEKWRSERKRKYPTKDTIEKKAAEIKEKINRGEKMGLNQVKRPFNNRGLPYRNSSQRHENHQQNRCRQQLRPGYTPTLNKIRKPILPKKVHNVLPAESLRKLKPFAGIHDILMENNAENVVEDTKCDFIIEDDDCEDLSKHEQKKTVSEAEPKVCGALSSLICDYDFSDDEVDGTNEDTINRVNTIKVKEQLPANNNISTTKENEIIEGNNQNTQKSDNDDGPEEIKIEKSEGQQTLLEPIKLNEENNIVKKKISVLKRLQFTRPTRKIPSTLLQKLLKREMQQERNIILQCVRHIVKNNYFDNK